MSIWDALIIGILQGITEFFPISSSAHLKIAKLLLGVEGECVLFDLACHLGTLVATLTFFRRDILALFTHKKQELLFLFLATLPLVPLYFLTKSLRAWAVSMPELLGLFFLVSALFLFLGHKVRIKFSTTPSKMRDVLCIGTMQAAALFPGISRSGATISCARILGWTPQEAVRFSFLLAIPTIIGGNSLELVRMQLSSSETTIPYALCAIGFISSAVVGCGVVGLAIRFLEKGNLRPFAWYCVGMGALLSLILR